MAKKIVKASIISATVGAAVGAAAVAVSKKENRDKAVKAVKDLKKSSTKVAKGLYQSARTETSKLGVVTGKTPAKKAVVRKATKKGGK